MSGERPAIGHVLSRGERGRPGAVRRRFIRKPERRRRLCLERMMFELQAMSINRMAMESRGPADDRRDRAMLDAMRASKRIESSLRMEHTLARANLCSGSPTSCAVRSTGTKWGTTNSWYRCALP